MDSNGIFKCASEMSASSVIPWVAAASCVILFYTEEYFMMVQG